MSNLPSARLIPAVRIHPQRFGPGDLDATGAKMAMCTVENLGGFEILEMLETLKWVQTRVVHVNVRRCSSAGNSKGLGLPFG